MQWGCCKACRKAALLEKWNPGGLASHASHCGTPVAAAPSGRPLPRDVPLSPATPLPPCLAQRCPQSTALCRPATAWLVSEFQLSPLWSASALPPETREQQFLCSRIPPAIEPARQISRSRLTNQPGTAL